MRRAVQSSTQSRSRTKLFPAPVRGLIENENLAASKPNGAAVLENWFPTQTGARLRGGKVKVATVGSSPVKRLFTYETAGGSYLFASTETAIFDVSALNPSTAPTAAVTGQTSGYYSTQQITTSGGTFVVAVNGDDEMQVFDGTAWEAVNAVANSMGLSITGVLTSALSYVWLAKSRLWFVEKNTLRAWYLPVDSVGGAAADLDLSAVFQRGGSLLFGASWSIDTGEGLDDKTVFVSDQGEVAIYAGGNPSDANDWALQGRYDIAKPLGPNAVMQAGGDLVIATVVGAVPLSEGVSKDPAALSISAVSRQIEPSWRAQAALYQPTNPWEMVKWPEKNLALVTLPHDADGRQFVVNLQTGSWAIYTGWDAQCATEWAGKVYFGQTDGSICEAERTGSDDGTPYECRMAGLWDHLGAQAAYKQVSMARAVFRAATNFNARVSASKDYTIHFGTAPNAATSAGGTLWDVAEWDVAVWDDQAPLSVTTRWVSVNEIGFVFSAQVQITCGDTQTPNVELAAIDFLYEVGGVVV